MRRIKQKRHANDTEFTSDVVRVPSKVIKLEPYVGDANRVVSSLYLPNGSIREIPTGISGEYRFGYSRFSLPCIKLAKKLLGKDLVRKLPNGEILRGTIVETESYLGYEDEASHSCKGKVTNRNSAMFMQPGTAYVYNIYGMYQCFNISSKGEGAAVLIRSLEPLDGIYTMQMFRSVRRQDGGACLKLKELCNGPSKLCQAMKIEKEEFNKVDLTVSEALWVENGADVREYDIIKCKRIGIESAGEEWANKPLRFYIRNNPFVSIRDKAAEIAENVIYM